MVPHVLVRTHLLFFFPCKVIFLRVGLGDNSLIREIMRETLSHDLMECASMNSRKKLCVYVLLIVH